MDEIVQKQLGHQLSSFQGRADLDAIARIAAAFATRDTANVEEVLSLVDGLIRVFQKDAGRVEHSQPILATSELSVHDSTDQSPALPVSKAVTNDKVFCLICGKGFSMLKRHLRAEHGITEDEYRAKFSLDKDFPLVAPSYSARRAEHARKLGLGKHSRKAVVNPST